MHTVDTDSRASGLAGTMVAVKCVIPRRGVGDEESTGWQDTVFSNVGSNSRSTQGSIISLQQNMPAAGTSGSLGQSKCWSPQSTLRAGSLSNYAEPEVPLQAEATTPSGPVASQRSSAVAQSRVSSHSSSNATAASQARPPLTGGVGGARELPPSPLPLQTMDAVNVGLSYSQLMTAHSAQRRGPAPVVWRAYGPEGGVPAAQRERRSSMSRGAVRTPSSESRVSL